jgi:hypothetical protein
MRYGNGLIKKKVTAIIAGEGVGASLIQSK